ncbi:unnamed protein product, partial [Staurois parvus]
MGENCCQEWIQHWWWDSPAVWAAVPELTRRVLSALVVGLSCRVGCSTRADQRVLSALVVGLSCRVGCSTRADQRVLLAARSSQSAKPGADYRKVYIRHDQAC